MAIALKDLRLRLRDRSVILYGVVAPLVLAVVLGGVFSTLDDGISVRLGVAPGDGEAASSFLATVVPALEADGLIEATTVLDGRPAAVDAVLDGSVDAVVVFSGDGAEVVGAAESPTRTAIVEAIVSTWSRESAIAAAAADSAAAAGAQPDVIEAVLDAVAASREEAALMDAPVGIEPLDASTYLSAGMAVFFLLFAVGIAVTGLLEEEQAGTLRRLHSTPIPTWAPLAAKALSAVVLGVASMTVLIAATSVIVGARWGAGPGLAALVLAAVLAATGVVSLVASLVRTPQSAQSATAIVGTVLGALGGAFFPVRGGGLAVVSLLTPHRWFLRGLTRSAGGAPLADLAGPIGVLLAMALVTGTLAGLRVHARQEG